MQWHFSRGGQVWGPYPWEVLASMAAAGQLLPSDLICTDGANWLPVTQFVALPMQAHGGPTVHYGAPPAAPTSTIMTTRLPAKPRTSKASGYACWAGAALLLIGAGIYLAMQVDLASTAGDDSAKAIEARLLKDGSPPDVAAKAAAGETLTMRDYARLPKPAQLSVALVPIRLQAINAHKRLPLTIVGSVLSLCAATILGVIGTSRIRRANKHNEVYRNEPVET
jgi:hypothetical protein